MLFFDIPVGLTCRPSSPLGRVARPAQPQTRSEKVLRVGNLTAARPP